MSSLSKVSDYELFAYVAPGFWALTAFDLLIEGQFIVGQEWTLSEAVLIFTASYIVGHIVASPAQAIMERQFVHRVLLPPSVTLFDRDSRLEGRRFLRTVLFRRYYQPLDKGVREKVWQHASKDSDTVPSGEALFWCAYSVAKRDASAAVRMGSFLKLYGFCRNMAFINICSFILFLIATTIRLFQGDTCALNDHPMWTGIALVCSIGMLIRYLEFYRLYSLEVFVAYSTAYSKEESSH